MKNLDFEMKTHVRSWGDGKAWVVNKVTYEKMVEAARAVRAAGYNPQRLENLKTAHVLGVVDQLREKGVSDDRIMNVMTGFRHWEQAAGKQGVVPSNGDLGLTRSRIATTDQSFNPFPHNAAEANAQMADRAKLEAFRESLLASLDARRPWGNNRSLVEMAEVSMQLMKEYGLRFEEATKIQPNLVVTNPSTGEKIPVIERDAAGNTVRLNLISHFKGTQPRCSWSKGGRFRSIPVTNPGMFGSCAVLTMASHSTTKTGSLTPTEKWSQWNKTLHHHATKAGFKFHGMRHEYAHRQYEKVTGMKPPVLGGPKYSDASRSERERIKEGYQVVAEHLGHGRWQVSKEYLGW